MTIVFNKCNEVKSTIFPLSGSRVGVILVWHHVVLYNITLAKCSFLSFIVYSVCWLLNIYSYLFITFFFRAACDSANKMNTHEYKTRQTTMCSHCSAGLRLLSAPQAGMWLLLCVISLTWTEPIELCRERAGVTSTWIFTAAVSYQWTTRCARTNVGEHNPVFQWGAING